MAASPWFLTSETAPGATPAADRADDSRTRVYCFPHAGGNPRTFLDWQAGMGVDGRIFAVCPPGRGHRFREPAAATVAELADGAALAIALDAAPDRPFVLFGHSFGAALAFEVARRLDGVPGLAALVASGCSAPSLLPTPRVVEAARLEGRRFTEAVGFFGGLPPEVLQDEAMQELLLPHLKADFAMVAGYQYRPAGPLRVPLTLLNGIDDPHVTTASLAPWARECPGEPTRHWVDGGHFYFEGRPHTVTDVLRPLARAARREAATPARDEYVELI
ncbi:thioesterase II family protein [Streptomyces sp. A1136]|uniref:thioesterase II family protein n=1 Tax=Streptomyces sp. A1136 TaxID=2563102 RepID=UPI001F1009A6|nr:alpha/beta fold hydrolase [Streptomyces sp. A1136]